MQTLAEFLKSSDNQRIVLDRITQALRFRGEWGSRGLFAKIGSQTGLTAAYVGRVLTGKQSITPSLLEKLPSILEIPGKWLLGETIIDEFGEKYGDKLSKDDFEELSIEYWKQQGIKLGSSPIMREIAKCLSQVTPETRSAAFAVFRHTCRMVDELSKDKEAMTHLAEELKKLSPACECQNEEV